MNTNPAIKEPGITESPNVGETETVKTANTPSADQQHYTDKVAATGSLETAGDPNNPNAPDFEENQPRA